MKKITITEKKYDEIVLKAFHKFNEAGMEGVDDPTILLRGALITAMFAAILRKELFMEEK